MGKTDKRLHDRTKLKHEEMQAEWDRIFGKKVKPKVAANQCDGCNAGMYKDVQGMHRDKDSNPIMICQEHKYKHKPTSKGE